MMLGFSRIKCCLITLFVIAICVLLIIYGYNYAYGWITYKSYLFAHTSVSSIAMKYAASKGWKLTS